MTGRDPLVDGLGSDSALERTDDVTWRYTSWSGRKATVVAATVEFAPTHVVWRDAEGAVVLAERPEHVNELAQVGTLGSSTRGTRPEVDQ